MPSPLAPSPTPLSPSPPVRLHDAAASLRAWAAQAAVHAAARAVRRRVRVHAPPTGALGWLRAQGGRQLLLFRCRDGDFEAAGVGFAVLEQGEQFGEEVHRRLVGVLGEEGMRFYGGCRFDGRETGEREVGWRRYCGFTFVLPAVELVRDGGGYWLCANLVPGGGTALDGVLAGLREPRSGGRIGGGVARPIAVENLTSFKEWDDGMRSIMAALAARRFEKIVLSRRKRFTFSSEARPSVLDVVAALEAPVVAQFTAGGAEEGGGRCGAREWGVGGGGGGGVGQVLGLEVETPAARGSYLFCLQLDRGCAFVGCTPERLFRVEGSRLLTQALAGTVRRGGVAEDGDAIAELCSEKNMAEHRFVVDYIQERLAEAGLAVATSAPRVVRLPRLMHLATDITGRFLREDRGERGVEELTHTLLDTMHPTPAVCGMPREVTMAQLPALEKFDRGFFAGPLGWFSADASDFCVAIRSALVDADVVTAYAGSGIVKGSESRSEWDETELKMSAFTDLFGAASTSAAEEVGRLEECSTAESKAVAERKPNGVVRKGVNGVPGESDESTGGVVAVARVDAPARPQCGMFDPRELAAEPNLNTLWGGLVVDELCRCGVQTFFVCPGSRSAPLAVAVTRSRRAQLTVVHDERGAAFMAVGFARATRQAAAVICSSGTAVANLLPAVVEASNDHVPLILLTGDRPPELRDVGANQAIDQVKIFGAYPRWFKDVPCPCSDIPVRNLLSDIDHAAYMCAAEGGGPVHLNFMFREKLAPDKQPWDRACLRGLHQRWTHGTQPYTSYAVAAPEPAAFLLRSLPPQFEDICHLLANCLRVLIVVGGGTGGALELGDRLAIAQLSEIRHWPMVSDIASGARLEKQCASHVPYGDLVFASAAVLEQAKIEAVVQFGERITSKRLTNALAAGAVAATAKYYVVVTPSSSRVDPSFTVTHRFVCPAAVFAEQLAFASDRLENVNHRYCNGNGMATYSTVIPLPLSELLLSASTAVESTLQGRLDLRSSDEDSVNVPDRVHYSLSEPLLARIVMSSLTASSHSGEKAIFIGNSMPIRDFDSYAACKPLPTDWRRHVLVGANRGASGIDGVLSAGVGFALGSGRPTVVVLGDMSFLHDLNALHSLRPCVDGGARCPPVTALVVNNAGGGIFSMLPIARHINSFSPTFDTPHGVSFSGLASSFGLEYTQVWTPEALSAALAPRAASLPRHRLIEVSVSSDHSAAAAFRRSLVCDVAAAADKAVAVLVGCTESE